MRKSLIGRILCFVGCHRWRYEKETPYMASGWSGHYRVCQRCKHREHHYWYHDNWR